jgi:hypothetical protein
VEIMLHLVPEARLQVAIASGALARKFIRSPLVRIRKNPARRQKLAEVLQLSQQMVFPRSVRTHIHISFAEALSGIGLDGEKAMTMLLKVAGALLEDHLASWQIAPLSASCPPKDRR